MLKKLSLLLCFAFLLSSCTKDPEENKKTPPPTPPPVKAAHYIKLVPELAVDLTFKQESTYEYHLTTTGGDPHIFTDHLRVANHPDSVVLTFEYTLNAEIDELQLFFADPLTEARSAKLGSIPASSTWKTHSINISEHIKQHSWGAINQYLRFDFGRKSGIVLKIRNIYLRSMTAEELEQAEAEQDQIKRDQRLEASLKEYLSAQYAAQITNVSVNVSNSKINISGNYGELTNCSICEITPYIDATVTDRFPYKTALTGSPFNVEFDRYVVRDGISYDRALSKWLITKVTGDKDEIVSTARYADDISPIQNMIPATLASKKGLGGVGFGETQLFPNDLTDLGISSVTLNVPLSGNMTLSPRAGSIAHTYGNVTYYFNGTWVRDMDAHLRSMQEKNILVAAIILINKQAECSDKGIGALLQHPSYTAEGIYTMPNMTTAQSVNCYAAGLDFLASRYSRADNANGRIHHWIMHNEVDAGIVWTNMGDKPITLYTDTYIKSMRMCYNIVRQYDAGSEIFGSFTHSWSQPIGVKEHASKDMLAIMNQFCKQEGDFKWALAYHCYPQDLNEPKTWNDAQATFSMNTSIISFKNLEVIDKWINKSENMYKGTTKRSLWLSENGTNSRSYSETDLKEQAAGGAYAWKKLNALSGIDAIQWHRWVDHRDEGGLRLGLRKFTDDGTEPGARKPVWDVYSAAGSGNEAAVFDEYLSIIGITDWNIIQPVTNF